MGEIAVVRIAYARTGTSVVMVELVYFGRGKLRQGGGEGVRGCLGAVDIFTKHCFVSFREVNSSRLSSSTELLS